MSNNVMDGNVKSYDAELKSYIDSEKAAVELQSALGSLLYNKSVDLVLFRNQLLDKSVSEILNLHKYAREVVKKNISVFETSALATELLKLDLSPSKLDIGKLASEWIEEGKSFANITDFVNKKLAKFLIQSTEPL